MGRTKKKQPNPPLRRYPERRRNKRVRYRTQQAHREGAPPPRYIPPHRVTTNTAGSSGRIAARREPRAEQNIGAGPKHREPQYPPTIKFENLTPKPSVPRLPGAPILHFPFRGAPSPILGLQVRAETPSPLVKIETPVWHPAQSVRIEPPLGFLRSRAADSPMVLRERTSNEKPPPVAKADLKTTINSEVQDASKRPPNLPQPGSQTSHSPSSLPALGTHQGLTERMVSSRGGNQEVPRPTPKSEDQGIVLQPKPPPAPSPSTATSDIQQSQSGTAKRLNLIEPIGHPRIVFPAKFVKYILDATFEFVDFGGTAADAYQVTAYIESENSDPSELYCGTFSRLENANEKVMQVFGRDPFDLMSERYTDMLFKEADEPGQGKNEANQESPQNHPWTAFGFDSTCPTLRIWAKDDEQNWSFRVEAVKV
ncbi:hypothetical protein F5X99DRAFT_430839 [Biscogniauxia marginata]|nr:hypothetical protein F5X99DRAFT_430839 [Biscogniauxia marginata]